MTHLDPDALALAAVDEDGLTPSQRDHLAACPDCSGELAALRRTVALARSAAAVELLRPADAVWGRIHDELGLSDAVAQQPRVEGSSAEDAGDAEDTQDAGEAGDTGDTGEAQHAHDAGDTDDTDHDTDVTDDTSEPVGAGERGASVTARSPRTLRSQGTLAFAAAAGLLCLVGGIAAGAWRPLPSAVVPAIP